MYFQIIFNTTHNNSYQFKIEDIRVFSSIMIVKKAESWRWQEISLSTGWDISFSSSFWMSCEVYLLHFLFNQSSIISSPGNFNIWRKLLSLSSPSPRRAKPCLAKYLIEANRCNNALLLLSSCIAYCWERCAPIWLVEEGKLITNSTDSRWQELCSCFWRIQQRLSNLYTPYMPIHTYAYKRGVT